MIQNGSPTERNRTADPAPLRLVAVVERSLFASGAAAPALGRTVLSHGRLAVILEPPAPRGEALAAARRAHALVTALWRHGPVLPGGAGSVFPGGAPEAQAWLTAHGPRLEAALRRIGQRGEFVVSLPLEQELGHELGRGPSPSEASGTGAAPLKGGGYLRARAAEIRSAQHAAAARKHAAQKLGADLAAALGAPAPLMIESGAGAERRLDLCFLAAKDAGPVLDRALSACADGAEASGPWPPYSLAGAVLGGGAGAGQDHSAQAGVAA